MRIGFLIGGLALAVGVIVVIKYGPDWFAEPASPIEPDVVVTPIEIPEAQTPVVSTPYLGVGAEVSESTEPGIALPGLDESDGFVLEHIASFDLPKMWIEREDLVRRLAVVVDNASKGEYPRRQLGFLAPTGVFKVFGRGEEIFIDPVSYSRYDVYLDIIEKIDAELLADVLLLFEPLLADGLAELGNQRGTGEQIDAAIDQILAVPVLHGEVRLLRPKVLYQYANPGLECLSPLQKQVLRTGPNNVDRLQRYLVKLQDALS
ncbi:MAG: DUF3014 domain-containing protein [Gammaproteobacteria bacterium]|nr:DUF3014 domain-containing protein [Gammaproteobacteria bacterium]